VEEWTRGGVWLGTRDGGGLRLRPEDAVPSRPVTSPPPPLESGAQVQQLQSHSKEYLRLELAARLSEAIRSI
jgi:hypothetical protein